MTTTEIQQHGLKLLQSSGHLKNAARDWAMARIRVPESYRVTVEFDHFEPKNATGSKVELRVELEPYNESVGQFMPGELHVRSFQGGTTTRAVELALQNVLDEVADVAPKANQLKPKTGYAREHAAIRS
jgi:hypothetical protein